MTVVAQAGNAVLSKNITCTGISCHCLVLTLKMLLRSADSVDGHKFSRIYINLYCGWSGTCDKHCQRVRKIYSFIDGVLININCLLTAHLPPEIYIQGL